MPKDMSRREALIGGAGLAVLTAFGGSAVSVNLGGPSAWDAAEAVAGFFSKAYDRSRYLSIKSSQSNERAIISQPIATFLGSEDQPGITRSPAGELTSGSTLEVVINSTEPTTPEMGGIRRQRLYVQELRVRTGSDITQMFEFGPSYSTDSGFFQDLNAYTFTLEPGSAFFLNTGTKGVLHYGTMFPEASAEYKDLRFADPENVLRVGKYANQLLEAASQNLGATMPVMRPLGSTVIKEEGTELFPFTREELDALPPLQRNAADTQILYSILQHAAR